MFLGIPLTPFNVIGFGILLLTAGVLWVRYARGAVSLLPVLYWVAIVAHAQFLAGGYDLRLTAAGLVCALFLRFEFLTELLARVVMAVEVLLLGYVGWRTVGLLLLW